MTNEALVQAALIVELGKNDDTAGNIECRSDLDYLASLAEETTAITGKRRIGRSRP
jgi:hypothetical protein